MRFISKLCCLFVAGYCTAAQAGIYWLPDYLKNNADLNHRTDAPLECSGYSLSCEAPKQLGGDLILVRENPVLYCYTACVCPSEYQYDETNCNGEFKLSSQLCDGKAVECLSKPCSDIGGSDSKARFGAVSTMFDFAFATCENKVAVDSERVLDEKCEVSGGKTDCVSVKPERSSYVFVNKTENPEIVLDVNLTGLKAPVKIGDVAGEVIVYKNGVETDRVTLRANEEIAKNTLWDAIGNIAKNWNV